jgi:hypothetical protein
MQTPLTHVTADHRAALTLAERLCAYGQPERALSVLDLAEWIHPGHDATRALRVKALAKLERWVEALDLILENSKGIAGPLLAQIYWAVGEKALGDHYFNGSERTIPPNVFAARRNASRAKADTTVLFLRSGEVLTE